MDKRKREREERRRLKVFDWIKKEKLFKKKFVKNLRYKIREF